MVVVRKDLINVEMFHISGGFPYSGVSRHGKGSEQQLWMVTRSSSKHQLRRLVDVHFDKRLSLDQPVY